MTTLPSYSKRERFLTDNDEKRDLLCHRFNVPPPKSLTSLLLKALRWSFPLCHLSARQDFSKVLCLFSKVGSTFVMTVLITRAFSNLIRRDWIH